MFFSIGRPVRPNMKYYSDGFLSSQYPKNKGGGFTVVDLNNNLIIRHEISQPGITNNEVELRGCLYALGIAQKGDTVSVDSKNTIHWIEGMEYHVTKNGRLKEKRARKDLDELKIQAFKLMFGKKIKLIWEPREVNFAGIYNEEFEK